MLTSIDFNYELSLETNKIQDEWAKRRLSPELDAAEPSIAQQAPESAFRIGHLPTQKARSIALPCIDGQMM